MKAAQKTEKAYKVTTLYYVMLGLFTALAFVATLLIQIPAGWGYINFGDAVVMIASVVLGPVGGAVTGLLGPAAADLATGFLIYAPFTAVIKAFEGLFCGLLYSKVLRGRAGWLRCLVAFAVVSLWVSVGYAVTDFLLVSFGALGDTNSMSAAWAAAVASLWKTTIQTGVSMAVAMIVSPKLPKPAHGKLFVGRTGSDSPTSDGETKSSPDEEERTR